MTTWDVLVADEFGPEFAAFPSDVQVEIAALARLLAQFGPTLKRPHCDTLKGSRYANMKELRFAAANGAWRVALRSTRRARRFCWWLAIRAA